MLQCFGYYIFSSLKVILLPFHFYLQDSQLIILTVHNFATQILPQWEAHSVQDVEMAVSLLYMLGEAVPVSDTLAHMLFKGPGMYGQNMRNSLLLCAI